MRRRYTPDLETLVLWVMIWKKKKEAMSSMIITMVNHAWEPFHCLVLVYYFALLWPSLLVSNFLPLFMPEKRERMSERNAVVLKENSSDSISLFLCVLVGRQTWGKNTWLPEKKRDNRSTRRRRKTTREVEKEGRIFFFLFSLYLLKSVLVCPPS